MPTKSLERWNRDGSFLQKQFESKGCEVELVYSDNDVNQQVNDIENLIADKVNLLVIAAIDGESLSNVLDSADQAGIPVISYDRLIMNMVTEYGKNKLMASSHAAVLMAGQPAAGLA